MTFYVSLNISSYNEPSRILRGTPLRSGRVTQFTRKFSNTCFFLLLTFVGHSSISCGTLIYLLSVGNINLKLVLYLFNKHIPILN